MILATTALAVTLTVTPASLPADGLHPSETPAAADMRGIEPSLYRGKWYAHKHEGTRRCIVHRESRGDYRARNRSSSASGAYQFLDAQWRDGLVHMMLREEPDGSAIRDEIRALFHQPIASWNRYWQDRAFWTAYRAGRGAHHWHYPPKPCPPGMKEPR